MRPTPNLSKSKLSVSLVAIGIGLVLVFCNSGRPEDAAKAKPSIKELEQKRLEVLDQVHQNTQTLFQNARIEYGEVLDSGRDLLAARLEYAQTREDRVRACDAAIEDAEKSVELIKARVAFARANAITTLKAQAYLLEAQIARAKLDADK
jgi:hypothetical protein